MRRTGLFVLASTAAWLSVLAFTAKISVDRLAVPAWGNTLGDLQSVPADADTVVGQTFVAPHPGLYRLELWLQGGSGISACTATLSRTSGSDAERILQVDIGADDLAADGSYVLELEPQRDSKGREYVLAIESAATRPDDTFTLAYGPYTVLEGATATVNGTPIPGNLRFQTYYTLRTRDKVGLLLSRMAEGRPYLLGSRGFYVVLGIAYAIFLAVFLWQIANLITGDRKGKP